MAIALIVIAAVVLVIVLLALSAMFVLVRQQGAVVIERLGKSTASSDPGFI